MKKKVLVFLFIEDNKRFLFDINENGSFKPITLMCNLDSKDTIDSLFDEINSTIKEVIDVDIIELRTMLEDNVLDTYFSDEEIKKLIKMFGIDSFCYVAGCIKIPVEMITEIAGWSSLVKKDAMVTLSEVVFKTGKKKALIDATDYNLTNAKSKYPYLISLAKLLKDNFPFLNVVH